MSAREKTDRPGLDDSTGRRLFLLAGGTTALGAALTAAGCGSSPGKDPDGGPDLDGVLVGDVEDFQVGSVILFDDHDLIVGRDVAGLYAMDAACTHAGCTLRVSDDRLPCPCHGSAFDFEGGVLNGPAVDPLVHYLVSVDPSGAVRVDPDSPVGADVRTPA